MSPIRTLLIAAAVAALATGCSLPAADKADPASSQNTQTVPNPDASKALQAYPGQMDGHVRHVITLPQQAEEGEFRVGLYASKRMLLDCNTRHMDGSWEERTAEGWGYPYWVLKTRNQVVSTMMACPPGSEVEGSIPVGQTTLLRYNSKLPVVVFVPEGVDLGWRIWRAGPAQDAPRG